jgi:hypothetical protein
MMTQFTWREVMVGASALGLAAATERARAQAQKPNILFIMADDLGYADVSCYGRREYTTTNIDRLAASGMRFLHAYANSAVCSATRTALITGRYQYRYSIGLEEPLTGRDVGLSPEVPTLPSLLKKAGYATALIGKWHLGSPPKYGPEKSGYDRFYGFLPGSSDYFNHANLLLNGTEKANDEGYLTTLLGDEPPQPWRTSRGRVIPSSSACTSTRRIGHGKARTTSPNRAASPRPAAESSISTAARSRFTARWCSPWTPRSVAC